MNADPAPSARRARYPRRTRIPAAAGLLACVLLVAGCGRQGPPAVPASGAPATVAATYPFPLGPLSPDDSALFKASCAGDGAEVGRLLDAGANANALDMLKRTPVFAAAFCNQPSVVPLLNARGADLTRKDMLGMTPLEAAAAVGGVDVARALLDAGAPVDERDGSGRTALHIAAATNQPQLAELLTSRGANAQARDAAGATPVRTAQANGHAEIAEQLKKLSGRQRPLPDGARPSRG